MKCDELKCLYQMSCHVICCLIDNKYMKYNGLKCHYQESCHLLDNSCFPFYIPLSHLCC